MTSLAESTVGLDRDGGLRPIDRRDVDVRFAQKVAEIAEQGVVTTGYRGQFDDRHGRNENPPGVGDRGSQRQPIGLSPQDGDDGRSVDHDHLGSPRSS